MSCRKAWQCFLEHMAGFAVSAICADTCAFPSKNLLDKLAALSVRGRRPGFEFISQEARNHSGSE